MTAAAPSLPAPVVLFLAPTLKDGALTRAVLVRAGIASACFTDLDELCDQLSEQTCAALLPEEALNGKEVGRLATWLAAQPPWSDLPLLILTRPGADSQEMARAMELMGNVTVLERPMRIASLVSAVRTALRARQRQYQIREHLVLREQAEEQLRANDRRKDEFLAMLAHELRNPLAPIRNSLHILRLTEAHNPASAGIGAMMERQVSHMVRLVDDLLEVSRITRGKIDLHRERAELGGVIRTAVETSRPAIEVARHQLHLNLPPATMVINCDPVRMAQVFSNLLNNAAKYSDPGGNIWLSVESTRDEVTITVRDSGLGIPREMLTRVFDLFTQVDRHSGHAQGGLGIGLTLVKRIVELHGGQVEAASAGPGAGSAFTVRLPLPVQRVLPRTLSLPSPKTSPIRRRVLVVDDNQDAGQSLGTLLELLGAEVQVVSSGPDALAALPVFQPAAVLLDIGMPGMDGHEVVRRIRQQSEYRTLTVIALTGWGQEEDRRLSREAGFDYHLVKPADLNALQLLLQSIEPANGDRHAAHS
jgi:signal transduction histidine kinase/CheY-like chemotaxis protein